MEAVRKKTRKKTATSTTKPLNDESTAELLAKLPKLPSEERQRPDHTTAEFPVDDISACGPENGENITPQTIPQVEVEQAGKQSVLPTNSGSDAEETKPLEEVGDADRSPVEEEATPNAGDCSLSVERTDPVDRTIDGSEVIADAENQTDLGAAVESAPPLETMEDSAAVEAHEDHIYPTLDSIPADIRQMIGDAPPMEEALESVGIEPCFEEPSAPALSIDPVTPLPESQKEATQIQRKTLKRVYPELELDELSVLPMSEAEILSLNRGILLQQRDHLEDTFIEMYSEDRLQNHELFKLLSVYYAERSALSACSQQVDDLVAKVSDLRQYIWSMGRGQVSAYNRCGDNTRIEKSHEYEIASYERHQAARLRDTLRQLEALLRADFASRNHSAQVLKTQIEQLLNRGLYPFQSIPKNAPVPKIGEHRWGREQESAKENLRVMISILFCFTRRPLEDDEFVKEIRSWLRSAVACLLRMAALEDHFFILSHVLRCPAGISEWAVELVQMPPFETWSREESWKDVTFQPGTVFDYPMLALSLICSPVKQRDAFLRRFRLSEESSAEAWCILNSENGDLEDEDLIRWTEQDIIELLNQIPFAEIFKYMLLVDDVYDVDRTTADHMLKLISFSTHFVYTLYGGLRVYNSPRYRDLTKLISRLIRHCVEYLTDHWESFRTANSDHSQLMQIQVEYDQFLLRAVNSIFFSESLGAWQFMAVLPYQNVSNGIMWQLLWLLHNNYSEQVQLVDMRVHEIARALQSPEWLEDKIEKMDDDAVFYLLTTFANMAISRAEANLAFIHTVVVEVFNITYIHERLREAHAKVGRDLLSRLVSKHPFAVSVLLDQVHQNMAKLGTMASYLFNGFELSRWIPEDEDLDILKGFLVDNDLTTPENALARVVLQNINYGFDEKTGQLFLPETCHQKVALIALAAYKAHYLPFDKTGYAYKQFKYLSDYALGTKQPARPDGFIQYIWDLILKLQLHLLDYPHPAQLNLITDEEPPIGVALCLEDTAALEPLRIAVCEGLPPALYIALMMCSLGHYREEIADKGMALIVELVSKDQFTAAVEAVARVSAVFIAKPELLVAHVKFLQAVEAIIQADNTYSAMVKNLVVTSGPGDILGQLARTIILQVRRAKAWNVQTKCVMMWFQILFNLPEMSIKRGSKAKARESVHFLLDTLVQLAYHEVGCIADVFTFLQGASAGVTPSSASSASVVRSVMSYVWWGSGSSWPILIPLPSLGQFPWLAWAGLVAESRIEQNSRPWTMLIREMSANSKLKTEQALKLVSTSTKIIPSQEFLLIYRIAQQALDTDMDHPAMPLLWQQFFQLYLQRSPTGGSVGLRLFESPTYHPMLKQLKNRLNELAEHYHRRHCDLARNLQEQPLSDHTKETGRALMQMSDACQLFAKLQKYFRTLYLWLEQPRLHDPNVTLLALPPPYNQELLKILLCGNLAIWTDLVYEDVIEENLERLSQRRSASKPKQAALSALAEQTTEQRILNRLKKYDETHAPPPLPIIKLAIPEVTEDVLLRGQRLLQTAKTELKTIMGHARAFNAQIIHLTNLDQQFDEQLKKLYTNEDRCLELYMPCSLGSRCKQHARLEFRFHEAQLSKVVDKETTENRNEWTTVLGDLRSPASCAVINGCAFIEAIIAKLVNLLQVEPGLAAQLRPTGGKLFAELVTFMDKDCLEHTPTRSFLTQCLEVLGQAVICPDPLQTQPLLDLILRNPHLVFYLSPYFAPAVCSPSQYAEMYSTLCYRLGPALYETQFILLSKFNVGSYLRATPTSALDRQNLIATLEVALQSIGRQSDKEPWLAKIAALYLDQMKALLIVNDFEHYFQILNMLLNGVRLNNIPLETFTAFYDILGYESIIRGELPVHCGPPGRRRVEESIQMMTEFFRNFRNEEPSARHNGLYCLCDYYLNSLAPLYTLMGSLYILDRGLEMGRHIPTASDIDKTLQAIFELYEPWFGVVQEGKDHLLPWLPGEKDRVSIMLKSYGQLLGLTQTVLSRMQFSVFPALWQRYFISYVWNSTPTFVATLYYEELLSLPWEGFVPQVADLRLMTKVLEPKYADHSTFLMQLFMRIDWAHLLTVLAVQWKAESRTEAYSRFAELLLKTGWDQSITASKRTRDLCASVSGVDWSCIPVSLVKDFLLVFEASCDPLCALLPDESSQDDVLFGFMQQLVCLRTSPTTTAVLDKQAAFFRMVAKLVRKCAATPGTRDLVKNRQCVSQFLSKHMACVNGLLTDPEQAEFQDRSLVLITAALSVLDIVDSPEWSAVLTDGLVEWIAANPGSNLILPLVTVATSLANQQSVPPIVEACISAYSTSEVEIFSSDGGWSTMLAALRFPTSNLDELLKAAVDNSCFLTLYAYILHKLPQCGSLEKELSLLGRIVDWVVESVPANEEAEPKILLLWEKILVLSVRQLEYNGDVRIVFRYLQQFVASLLQTGEDKISVGLLGAIGFGRRSPYSMTFRFNSRVIAAIVAQHLTEDGLVLLQTNSQMAAQHKAHRFAQEAVSKVKAMQGNKAYAELSNELEAALELVNNCNGLIDSQEAVKQLANFFYPTLAYLKVLFFGVMG